MKVEQKTLDHRMDAFAALCRQAGIRATHQRTEVFREVARTEEHPDAESVYRRVKRRIPAISLDTVYRTLRLLDDKGLISKVSYPGDRTRFDANSDHHHHFICTKCGRIIDFESEQLDEMELPEGVESLGTAASRQLQVYGICRDCEE